jgi:hypothetical protein
MFELTRRAANASYSNRTAKVGRKPQDTLQSALAVALQHAKGENITIHDTETGLRGRVIIYTGIDGGQYTSVTFPDPWAKQILTHGMRVGRID